MIITRSQEIWIKHHPKRKSIKRMKLYLERKKFRTHTGYKIETWERESDGCIENRKCNAWNKSEY